MKVAVAQINPVWLWRERTVERVVEWIDRAAADGCGLVVFGEGLIPGYPFWVEHTDGARFESPSQKAFHAHYLDQAVQIEAGHLNPLCVAAREHQIAVYVGVIERPVDRGGHSVYASLVYIDPDGQIGSVHRKLMPTYEERLVWSTGDGHGLRVHALGEFTVGGLNCWENWMPLARAALYAQGENLHVAVWPGNVRNTEDITRFIAREARSYVVSAAGLMGRDRIPEDLPQADALRAALPEVCANGGSCVAGPDGEWLLPPQQDEGLFVVQLDRHKVLEERQNFDPAGHYSRPDVTHLTVNRQRQSTLHER